MKKYILLSVIFASAVVMFSSCKFTSSTIKTNSKISDVAVKPYMADLSIAEDITIYEYVEDYSNFTKKQLKALRVADEKELVGRAVFSLLKEKKGDVLVSPQYQIKRDETIAMGMKRSPIKITMTITGHIGKYSNFRPVPEISDFELNKLDSETSYVVVEKDNEGKAVGYKVVSNFKKPTLDINLDDYSQLDKIVVGKKGRK